MPPENESNLDYVTFIADLEAKRALLDSAIASLKAAVASGAIGPVSGSMESSGLSVGTSLFHNGEIPAGAFLRKSIPEAARLYLSTVKKKQTTKEIADALLEGGMETNAKNFEVTVGTGLYRVSNKTGEFVRLKGGAWGLSEWYPSAMRVSPEKREKHKGRKPRKSKPKEPKEPKVLMLPEKSQSTKAAEASSKKLSDRIVEMLNGHPNQEFTAKELSEKLGVNAKVVAMMMATLAKKKLVRRPAPDTYGAAQN